MKTYHANSSERLRGSRAGALAAALFLATVFVGAAVAPAEAISAATAATEVLNHA